MERKVIVKDKDTLMLEEDAIKGDIICLNKISNVDLSSVQELLHSEMEKETQRRIEEALSHQRSELEAKHEAELRKKELDLEKQWRDRNQDLSNQLSDAKHHEELKLKEKEAEIDSLKKSQADELKFKEIEVKKSLQSELDEQKYLNQKLTDQLTSLKESNEKEKANLKQVTTLELENKFNQEKEQLKDSFLKEKADLEHLISQLQNTKAALNVKRIGENLEDWCANEVRSYMQNGFFNCTWQKDNSVVQETGESKGSKADYLFWIYASEAKKEDELLTGICMDMKDENPDSVNRKSNSDYYRQLDKNRTKKGCKYAVLVSNLELDRPNDIPIYRVSDYPDMYVVRPAYLMTFLNMIVSLTTYFSKLIMGEKDKTVKEIAFEEYHQTLEEVKNTYLDKPLANLEKSIDSLQSQNKKISDASQRISETIEDIKMSYIQEIQNKLSRLSERLGTAERKYLRKIEK